jgi:polyisoprenoid-binding protein YceI
VTSYRVLPERSRLWAEARSSLHPIHVETTGLTGYLEIELEGSRLKPDVAVSARIELEAERLKTGTELYDHELERRLELERYPRITGTVHEVHSLDSGRRYLVRGELSLHGVTRKVSGEVTIRIADDRTIEVEGEKELDMRDYGLDPPRLLMLRVYPEIRVRARVVAERERG